MNVGIIGAGAMGCIYGMYLSRKHSVLLVDVVQAHVDAINENGLEFTHLDGTTETVTRLRATTDTSSCTPADLVILLTKGYQSAQALEANSTLIGPDTIVCSLQNGYGNADDIEKYVPTEQIVLGTSGGGATVAGPGRILHKGQGPTQLGCLTEDQSRAELVARAMSECGVPQVELIPDVKELLWSKLFVNVGINAICALTGETNQSIANNPFSNAVSSMLVREAVEVANAVGMDFDGRGHLRAAQAQGTQLRPGLRPQQRRAAGQQQRCAVYPGMERYHQKEQKILQFVPQLHERE